MTHAPWPGTARKPGTGPPATPALPEGTWLAVGIELLQLAATLAVIGLMLALIRHVGGAPS